MNACKRIETKSQILSSVFHCLHRFIPREGGLTNECTHKKHAHSLSVIANYASLGHVGLYWVSCNLQDSAAGEHRLDGRYVTVQTCLYVEDVCGGCVRFGCAEGLSPLSAGPCEQNGRVSGRTVSG